MDREYLDRLIEAAIDEDMPRGDITSESVIPPELQAEAVIQAKEEGILAGLPVAKRVFEKLDSRIKFEELIEDGQAFRGGDFLAKVTGSAVSILKGERTALNFLQRLCGIATRTRHFVRAVEGTGTKILDTRKTTPTLRVLEKYAVRMGGGENHRLNLSEMVLLKDNHLRIVGSIGDAIKQARGKAGPGAKIEVEVTNFREAEEAVDAGAFMIMLDNMSFSEMRRVVDWARGRVAIEVSGKVDLRRVRRIASLGVDFISVGSLTHSFKSVDISLEFIDTKSHE